LIVSLFNTFCSEQGSLEDQLSRLREYEEAVYQFKPHLEELERVNQQIQVPMLEKTFFSSLSLKQRQKS
jgi:actinin alpha 1/4